MDIKSSWDGAAGFKSSVDGGVHLRPDIGKIIPNFFAFELTDVIGNSDFAFLTESGYFLKGKLFYNRGDTFSNESLSVEFLDVSFDKLVSVSTLRAKSIRGKLLLLVLPIVAIGLIVLSGVIYRYMDEVLER